MARYYYTRYVERTTQLIYLPSILPAATGYEICFGYSIVVTGMDDPLRLRHYDKARGPAKASYYN